MVTAKYCYGIRPWTVLRSFYRFRVLAALPDFFAISTKPFSERKNGRQNVKVTPGLAQVNFGKVPPQS